MSDEHHDTTLPVSAAAAIIGRPRLRRALQSGELVLVRHGRGRKMFISRESVLTLKARLEANKTTDPEDYFRNY